MVQLCLYTFRNRQKHLPLLYRNTGLHLVLGLIFLGMSGRSSPKTRIMVHERSFRKRESSRSRRSLDPLNTSQIQTLRTLSPLRTVIGARAMFPRDFTAALLCFLARSSASDLLVRSIVQLFSVDKKGSTCRANFMQSLCFTFARRG